MVPTGLPVSASEVSPSRPSTENIFSPEVQYVMSQDDLHLCEGLLNIFIKPNAERQVITYKKSRIERSSCPNSARLRDAVLDFGSYKETIYVGSSSSSQTPSEFEAVCEN